MTTLRKTILQTFIPGSPGSPAVPGQQYQPARTAYEEVQECRWEFNSPPSGGTAGNIGTGGGGSGPIYPSYTYVCKTVVVRRDYPARPYTPAREAVPERPAQFLSDYQLGWNGRATSIKRMIGNGYFKFKAPIGNIGAVVGLSIAPQDTGFSDILNGFYLAGGVARVYEAGVQVEYIGGYVGTDVFKIQRAGSNINYLINSTLVHQSAARPDPMFLTASLYSGGDSVEAADFVGETRFVGSMLAADGHWGDTAYTAMVASGSFLPMTGIWGINSRFEGSMRPATAMWSDHVTARFEGVMQPVTGFFEGIEAPPYAIFNGVSSFMASALNILVGQVITCDGSMLEPVGLFYDRKFGDFQGSMRPAQGYWDSLMPAGEVLVFSGVNASGLVQPQVEIFVVMNSHADVLGMIVTTSLMGASMLSYAEADAGMVVQQTIEALLASTARLHSLQFDDVGDVVTWALNAATAGTTRYENYNFNSFAKVNGKFYGMKASGLYELAGPTDAGAPVRARVNLGNNSFGTSLQKSMSEAYVGVASDGAIVVKVVANDETYLYTARSSSDVMKTQRVEFGRGFKATFFELEIQNSPAGGAFDLASIEFTPVPLKRRI